GYVSCFGVRLVFVGLLFLYSCNNEEETWTQYDSVEGKWEYETPDRRMRVQFEIVSAQGELKIQSGSIFVNDNVLTAKIDEFTSHISGSDIHSIYLYDEELSGIYILFQQVTYNETYTELYARDVGYAPAAGEKFEISWQVMYR